MLTELHITDFALVDRIALAFGPGLNVLTGETGAGKSIIVDAIGAVLGDRSGPEAVRSGADRARIDATFQLDGASSGIPEEAPPKNEPNGPEERLRPENFAEERLRPENFAEEGLLLITRDLSRTGRSGIRINGRPATLAMVREITGPLVDLHGQHEHQSLLDPDRHAEILDRWIGREAMEALAAIRAAHRCWSDLQRERSRLVTDEKERNRRLDLLRYQVDEIDAATLRAGEEAELAADRGRLAGAEKLFACAAEAMSLLGEEETNATERIGIAAARLRDGVSIDPSLRAILEAVETALFTLEEAVRDLSDYRDGVEFNPDRLNEVEERIDLLRGLKRKYGETIEEMLAYRNASAREAAELEVAEERSHELDEAIGAALAELERRCDRLSRLRHAAAPDLERALMRELADLGMEKTAFSVQFASAAPGPAGAERVEFLLSANPGEPLKPLAKIASGGEISRIMLALKSVAAQAGGAPVMIFDEIDVGVGGRTGSSLAAKLRALGERSQVLCVTHLPQIAAAAHRHFAIQKAEERGRTVVRVHEVIGSERVAELARMLGGGAGAAVDHARELLNGYASPAGGVHV